MNDDDKTAQNDGQKPREDKRKIQNCYMIEGMNTGLVLGLAIGMSFDNMVTGMIVGMLLGMAGGLFIKKKK